MKLKINECSFSYNIQLVLDHISMQISEGEVVSIIGPNGSGKSTLLRCICRVLQPRGGVVYLNNQDVAHLKPRELARLLGYVPQSGAEVFPLTVYEAVLLGRKPYLSWGVGPKDREIVDRILRFMKIEEFALKYINEMSGGEKQRVLIARALAQEPEVLLLDEPTSNLDIKHQLEVLGLMQKFAHDGGMTVIMVLHDLNLASRFSDKLVLINEGKVFASGPPAAVLNPANIRAVYDVEADVDQNGLGIQVLPLRSINEDEEDITSLFGELPVEERQSRAVR
ncbi:MAG: ABC transporter ATP-binding protein [Syntrophaceticus schinkii]|nr:ABC transporter ATP-binding protein [Syntrophaceticus schinkii]MDD4262507.1 ABC transporter ATP-binding protein [Syntrophaceticus schinkii]MDD4675561.1 ABC transporter ATP-binding protein [Syntrophaceticus schinkii]